MDCVIVELSVENIAIIDRASLTLGPGLTVFTGETGAGKSLLVDSIELAFGSRADTDLVRAGAARAAVSVAIDLSASPRLSERCQSEGFVIEDGALYIQREVFAEGRSQCRIGGKLAPLSQLKRLGGWLVDLQGQHNHQTLLQPETHISLLDDWIGDAATDLKLRIGESLESLRALDRRLSALRQGARDRELKIDLLKYQVAEIDAFGVREGEFDELENQEARLRHAEKLQTLASASLRALEDESGGLDALRIAAKELGEASRFDTDLSASLDLVRQAQLMTEEAIYDVRRYLDALEADPARLQEIQERIDGYKRLFRKYGDNERDVLERRAEAALELEATEGGDASVEELTAQRNALFEGVRADCDRLSALRRAEAKTFVEATELGLRDLAIADARFDVKMESKEPDIDGSDRLEFIFSANKGEPLRPLSKIASGGEISRVALAAKAVFAGKAGPLTLIFDEADAGIGGRAASSVAAKLEALAEFYQVIAITHLPQIAARATTHYRIDKATVDGRIVTRIEALSPDERVEELARMIAGDSVNAATREHARALLEV